MSERSLRELISPEDPAHPDYGRLRRQIERDDRDTSDEYRERQEERE